MPRVVGRLSSAARCNTLAIIFSLWRQRWRHGELFDRLVLMRAQQRHLASRRRNSVSCEQQVGCNASASMCRRYHHCGGSDPPKASIGSPVAAKMTCTGFNGRPTTVQRLMKIRYSSRTLPARHLPERRSVLTICKAHTASSKIDRAGGLCASFERVAVQIWRILAFRAAGDELLPKMSRYPAEAFMGAI